MSKPRLKATFGRWPQLLCVLVAVVIGGLLTAALLTERTNSPSPAFPNTVNGTSVIWVPDTKTRAVAAGLTVNDVAYIQLSGSNRTGVPAEVTVTRKETIGLFLEGIRHALKRGDYPYGKEACPPNAHGGGVGEGIDVDYLLLGVRPRSGGPTQNRDMIFFADLLEGEQRMMPCGTVSPRFQDALRSAGIPRYRASNIAESLINDFAVRWHNR